MKSPAKLWFSVAACVAILCASRQAAWAITPTVSASPNPWKGNCPVTVNFSGTITTAGPGLVGYYFSYFDPGKNKTINTTTKVITAKSAGPIDVSDSGVMTLSGTGTVTLYETAPVAQHSTAVAIPLICSSAATGVVPIVKANSAQNYRSAVVTQMPGSFTTQNLSLTASDERLRTYNYGGLDIFVSCNATNMCVGFSRSKTSAGPVVITHQMIDYRSYLLFPTPKLQPGVQFVRATLTLHITGDSSCYGGIGPAVSAWTNNKNNVDGIFSYSVPPNLNGNMLTLDVSPIVKDWMSGKVANNGFVLRGSNETDFGPDNVSCQMHFAPPSSLAIKERSPMMQLQH